MRLFRKAGKPEAGKIVATTQEENPQGRYWNRDSGNGKDNTLPLVNIGIEREGGKKKKKR